MKDNSNGSYNGVQYPSRKWKLVLLVVILATIGAFLPPLISAWLLGAEKPMVLLSGTEWVSVITLSVSAYFGANVWQKHVKKRHQLDLEASGVVGDATEPAGGDDDKEEDDSGKEA